MAMCKSIFGVCATKIEAVQEALRSKNVRCGIFPTKLDRGVLLVHGVDALNLLPDKTNLILVVFDVAAKLNMINGIEPVDYDVDSRGYALAYRAPLYASIIKATNRTTAVTYSYNPSDQLFKIINELTYQDDTLNKYIALTSNIDANSRQRVERALKVYFKNEKELVDSVYSTIANEIDANDDADLNAFIESFNHYGPIYRDVLNNHISFSFAAKSGADTYAISYFRKKLYEA